MHRHTSFTCSMEFVPKNSANWLRWAARCGCSSATAARGLPGICAGLPNAPPMCGSCSKTSCRLRSMTSTIARPQRESRDAVVIRFAGDSGDGMQVTGSQFTLETALAGSDFSTFPDFPAEIRAPAGTTFGVSAFQLHFGGTDVMTPGDAVDVLVAMNPAALTVEL